MAKQKNIYSFLLQKGYSKETIHQLLYKLVQHDLMLRRKAGLTGRDLYKMPR